jgi:hypothetical protein
METSSNILIDTGAESQPETTSKTPKLEVPKDFTGEMEIKYPSGTSIIARPKQTEKGPKEHRWFYPSITGEVESVHEVLLLLGNDRVIEILKAYLDEDYQYAWRHYGDNHDNFLKYLFTGKVERESNDPAKLTKDLMALKKEFPSIKAKGDEREIAEFRDKISKLQSRISALIMKEDLE